MVTWVFVVLMFNKYEISTLHLYIQAFKSWFTLLSDWISFEIPDAFEALTLVSKSVIAIPPSDPPYYQRFSLFFFFPPKLMENMFVYLPVFFIHYILVCPIYIPRHFTVSMVYILIFLNGYILFENVLKFPCYCTFNFLINLILFLKRFQIILWFDLLLVKCLKGKML